MRKKSLLKDFIENHYKSTKLAEKLRLSPVVRLERLNMLADKITEAKKASSLGLSEPLNEKVVTAPLISPDSTLSVVIPEVLLQQQISSSESNNDKKEHNANVLQECTNVLQQSRITTEKQSCLSAKRKISDVIPSTPSKRQVSLLHYYRSPSVEHSNAKVTNEHNTPPSSKSNETIRGEEIAVVRDLDGFCEENGSLLTESPLNEDSEFASSEHQKRCSVSKGLWPIHYVNEKKKLDCSSADKQVSKEPIRFTNITSKCHRSSQKALSRNVDNKEQLIIDAGQKTIGARMCHECGMLYSANCDEDTFLHVRIHNHLLLTLRFTGWKRERVVREFVDGRVILILPEDPTYALKKVESIKRVMDENLGFHDKAQPDSQTMQVYIFVSDSKVVGCLISEAISKANKALPSTTGDGPPMCSVATMPAICGVNRIWTLATHRRKKIATRLVECMRTRFYYGCEIRKDQIAFSDPTPDGRRFAIKYSETEEFLVYK